MVYGGISIPGELEVFLKSPSVSLLIKGLPGTGKTILALSILRMLGGLHGFYVTTRIKPRDLVEDYPWIGDSVPVDHIVDASKSIFSRATLREAEKDFGFIRYSDKPSFIGELYELLRGRENALIVFDSIEGIQEATAERIYVDLLDFQREMGLRMIFVSEYEDERGLDYLVDGVVLLRREFLDGEQLRIMQIGKLRGAQCKKFSYIFTLDGGVFKHFEPFEIQPPRERRRFEPLPDSETRFSSGIRDLDNILGGGYEKGSTILLEVGKNVVKEAYIYFVMLTATNFLSKGKGAIGHPSLGVSMEQVYSYFLQFIGEENAKKAIVIKEGVMEGKTRSEIAQEFLQSYRETIRKVEPEGCGVLWGVDSLLNRYGNRLIPILEQAKFETQNKKLLAVWVVKHGTEIIDKVASMADYHFRIEERGGVFLFQSLKPRSRIHVIEVDYSQGYPTLKLNPLF